MKKLALLLIAVFGLFMVACEKANIQPNTTNSVAPEWETVQRGAATGGQGGVGVENDTDDEIVDPNDDEDGHGKTKV